MMYYRVAIQANNEGLWKWKSTPLDSLGALFQLLRLYNALPQNRLRVFMASSRQELDGMLARENKGMDSTSVTAEQFLSQRRISSSGSKQAGAGDESKQPRRVSTIALPPLAAQSAPAESLPQEQGLSTLERRRWELEMGEGGDHDEQYTFALPLSMPQALAWTKLLVRVKDGELLS